MDLNIFETIKAVAVLDENGRRLFGKYYDKDYFPTNKDCLQFEKNLLREWGTFPIVYFIVSE